MTKPSEKAGLRPGPAKTSILEEGSPLLLEYRSGVGVVHTVEAEEVLRSPHSDAERGLGSKEAARRLGRERSQRALARGLGTHVVWVGIFMAVVSLAVGLSYFGPRPEIWQTMVFTTLTFSQMAHVLAVRSDKSSFFSAPLSNPPLLAAVAGTLVLQPLAVYWSFFQGFPETEALPLGDLAITVGLSTIIFFAVEVEKLVKRLRDHRTATPS